MALCIPDVEITLNRNMVNASNRDTLLYVARKKRLLVFGVCVVAVILGMYAIGRFVVSPFRHTAAKPDYVIPGVVPIDFYSDAVSSPYVNWNSVAHILTVFRYWGETINIYDKDAIDEIKGLFRVVSQYPTIPRYFAKKGFQFRREILKTPQDLKKYINAETRTPLFFSAPMSKEIPILTSRLLIGVNEQKKVVILHNFRLGNNVEMAFADLDALWNQHPYPSSAHLYWVIEPLNASERRAKLFSTVFPPYPTRPAFADALRPLLVRYSAGRQYSGSNLQKSSEYFSALISDPRFGELHPVFQISAYMGLARNELKKKNAKRAREHLEAADKINQDLHVPYRSWPGVFPIAKSPFLFQAWSEYYTAVGNSDLATQFENKYKALLRDFEIAIRAMSG